MKKIIKISALVLLTFIMLLCAVACTAPADKEKGLHYVKYNQDDFYTVTSYNGEDTTLSVPETYNGFPVGRIGANAFTGNETLTSLVIPTSVTKIDKGAFAGMKVLEKITLPFVGANANSDAFFGETADAENKAIDEKRTFGYVFGSDSYEGATTLTQNYDSSNNITYAVPLTLKEITIASKENYSIPMYAFSGNTIVNKINLDSKIDKIGDYAFSGCVGLTTLTVPSNVDYIGDYAFSGCANLKDFNSQTLKGFKLDSTKLEVIGEGAFIATKLKVVSIPDSVKVIGDKCFANDGDNASLIEKVIFSSSSLLTSIGNYAFYNCAYLNEVNVPQTAIVGVYAFYGCDGLNP